MKPTHDHTEEIGFPNHVFINTASALDFDQAIILAQQNNPEELLTIKQRHPITQNKNHWTLNNRLVVVGNNDLKRGVINLYHKLPTSGHPGSQKNPSHHRKRLLVALNATRCSRLCKRMRNMSSHQTTHHTTKTPLIPD